MHTSVGRGGALGRSVWRVGEEGRGERERGWEEGGGRRVHTRVGRGGALGRSVWRVGEDGDGVLEAAGAGGGVVAEHELGAVPGQDAELAAIL